MPQLISGFQKIYPNVQFLFHQGDYSSIQEWIKIGAVDFGFVSPNAVTDLEVIPIKDGEMLAVLSENHPLANKEPLRLRDLAEEPFILLEEGHYSEPLLAFQEAGLGVSILAKLLLRRTNYHVVCRSVDPPIFRTLGIAYKDKSSLPIASKYFIEYLLANVDTLP